MPYKNHYQKTYFSFLDWLEKLGKFFLFFFFLGFVRNIRAYSPKVGQICNDILPIAEDINIPIVCDSLMSEHYLNSPEYYQNDILELHKIISSVIDDFSMHCRIAKVAENVDFKIQLVYAMPSNDVAAQYTMNNHTLKLKSQYIKFLSPIPYKNNDFQKNFEFEIWRKNLKNWFRLIIIRYVYHEFDHAYMHRRNEETKTNIAINEEGNIDYNPYPFNTTDPKERETFIRIVNDMHKNITEMAKYYRNLTTQEKVPSLFEQYQPKAHELYFSLESLSNSTKLHWFKQMFKQTKYMGKIFYEHYLDFSGEGNTTYSKVFLYMFNLYRLNQEKDLVFFYYKTVNSNSHEARRNAAYFDAEYKFNYVHDTYNKLNSEIEDVTAYTLMELNAHFQELYGPFPKIFKELFPKLFKFHEEKDRPLLGKCLDNPEKKRSHYPCRFFNTTSFSKSLTCFEEENGNVILLDDSILKIQR